MGRRNDYLKIRKSVSRTGAEKLISDWGHRAATSLRNLVDVSYFRLDVQKLRLDRSKSLEEKTFLIIQKYWSFGLRNASAELVSNYIETGEVNPFVMRPPVIAVSTKEGIAGPAVAHNSGRSLKKVLDKEMQKRPNEWVYLVIDPECAKEDMEEWVASNWDWFMEGRLYALRPRKFKRVKLRGQKNIKRNLNIYEHIKVKKRPAKPIADEYGISAEYARKIAREVEKQLTTDI